MKRFLAKVEPWTYMAMRIVAGVLFACHGAQKLLGVFGGQKMALVSKFGLAGVIELFGGLLIAVGLFVSPVAFLASGEMAYAFFTLHLPRGVVPIQNGGELAALYCFVFLYIAARGRR